MTIRTLLARHGARLWAVVVAIACLLPAHDLRADPNPFSQLAGAWRGSGTVSPLGSHAERVLCRVSYDVSGNDTHQTMDCAGTDYRIIVSADLTVSGGKLSGRWSESNFGVSGRVGGIAKGNTIYVRISSEQFSGRMTIKAQGNRHTVHISQFDAGSGRYSHMASITLRR